MQGPIRSNMMLLAASLAVLLAFTGCGSSSGSQTLITSPAFTLAAPSTVVSVAQGASGSTTVTTTISGGFDSAVTLTTSELPAGVTIAFTPASIAAPGSGSTTVTMNVNSVTTPGSYIFLVTATGDGLTQKVQIPLTVTAATTAPRLIGYLPDYDGSYANFAATLDFTKMTHLDLAFAVPPPCTGSACTASSDMTWSLSSNLQSDAEITALVTAAHSAGVKVLLSIGGGNQDEDTLISQFYNAGLSTPLAASLDTYLTAHNLDGVDVDIENPTHMGTNYEDFVAALVAQLHPEGKIVSAAVAQWIQSQNVMSNTTLQSFDFVTVMVYSNLADCQSNLTYFAGLGEPIGQMSLGVPFFGQTADGSYSATYAQISPLIPTPGNRIKSAAVRSTAEQPSTTSVRQP